MPVIICGLKMMDADTFISYLDDNGKTVSGFAQLISLTSELLTFKTDKNVVATPLSRVLKIKQKPRQE